jgi:hypothetical protein
VNSKQPDIAQIRRYLSGELDARAMHELERQAQDDPFLMDALDGYGNSADQQLNLSELEERLAKRAGEKQKDGGIVWRVLAIAAVLLVITITGYLFYNNKQAAVTYKVAATKKGVLRQQSKSANNDLTNAKEKDKTSGRISKPAQTLAFAKHRRIPQSVTPPVDIKPQLAYNDVLKKLPLEQEFKAHINDSDKNLYNSQAYAHIARKDVMAKITVVKADTAKFEHQLQSRAAGVNITTASGEPLFLKGKVVDVNGMPLPGVSVKVMGDRKPEPATVTDANGSFAIAAIPKKETLSVNYLGYQSEEINIKNADSIKVALKERVGSLSEVVVTGYGTVKNIAEASAHPRDGWDNYYNYLSKSAVKGGDKDARVKLSFIVKADGTLAAIHITKGSDSTINEKAVRLIQNGPPWVGNRNGKDKVIKLRLKFRKHL